MGKVAAGINSAYVLAGVVLFLTGEAPVVQPGVKLFGDKFSMAWAGWKFSGCLYMALVNWGVPLGISSAISMVPYMAFDIFAMQDPAHWTPLARAFLVLDGATLVAALVDGRKGSRMLMVGGVINAAYVLAGVALFATGKAPVITPGVDFLGNKFAMAWAGWKFCGCFYFALVNLGVDADLTMAIAMLGYILFDLLAVLDSAHWTSLSGGFIVFDGLMGMLALRAFTSRSAKGAKKTK